MKLTKKVLSIALALMLVVSCLAVSVSADTSALKSDKYDDNILISLDQYIRDYSYGTGISAHCPQQLSFNKDGWMRIQSQTEEQEAAYLTAKANGDATAMEANEGQYEHQWELSFKPTPEYQVQFKNAVANAYENYDGIFAFYGYVASAKLANPNGTYNDSATIDFSTSFKVEADIDGDGEYETTTDIGSQQSFSTKHSQYNYRYQNTLLRIGEISDYIDMDIDFRLKSIIIQPRNYDTGKGEKNEKGQEGIGLIDIYISPCYVENIPGFKNYNRDNYLEFNAEASLDPASFTIGKINTDDWQWEEFIEPTENYDNLPVFGHLGYGDMERDENNCPIMKNGTSYNPTPIVKVKNEAPVVCSNLKATVKGSSVTLTWTATGGTPKSFFVHESTGKYSKTVTTTSATISNLPVGTYQFRVKGTNSENKQGSYTGYVTVKIAPAVCTHSSTTTVTKPATYFATGYKQTVCKSCKKVIKKTTLAKLKLSTPKVKYTSAKGKFTVKYTAVKGATGFEVKYKVGSKWKTTSVSTKKSTSKTITLKKGTYQVQVRAVVKSGSKKAYSSYTKLTKVKVK